MITLEIGIRNIARNPRKHLPTLVSIAVAIAALFIYSGSNEHIFSSFREMVIREQLGGYRIHARGFAENGKREPFDCMIRGLDGLSKGLASIQGVDFLAPRLHFTAIATGDAGNAILRGFGGDPDSEARMARGSTLRGRRPEGKGNPQALLGEEALSALSADIGSTLTILSAMEGGGISGLDIEVVGAKKGGGESDLENRMLIMTRLEDAQLLLGLEDACDTIIVHTKELLPGKDMDGRIAAFCAESALEYEKWDELAVFYERSREVFAMNQNVLTAILLLVAFFILGNAMYMNFMTRMREIGTMRAMGTSKPQVRAIFLSEGLALSIVGGAAGIAAASAFALAVNSLGGFYHPSSVFNDEAFYSLIMPSWGLVAAYWGLFIAVSAASSLAVSRRALGISVSDSLRAE